MAVLGTNYPAILEHFKKSQMKGQDYSGNAIQVETYADIKEKVVSTPGAIGFSTAALLDESIQPIRYSGGMRIVTLITKGTPSPKVEKLIEFTQKEGKKYIKQ